MASCTAIWTLGGKNVFVPLGRGGRQVVSVLDF